MQVVSYHSEIHESIDLKEIVSIVYICQVWRLRIAFPENKRWLVRNWQFGTKQKRLEIGWRDRFFFSSCKIHLLNLNNKKHDYCKQNFVYKCTH